MILLICPACIITVGISPLSCSCFVAVCLWCICTEIPPAFIYASFIASMRDGMPFFPGTTLAHLIATSYCRLEIRSTIICFNPKALHTLCILIGLQHPSEICFPSIHIPNALLKNSSCGPGTSINGPRPSRKYAGWKNIVDALGFMNLYTMDTLELP